MAPRTVILGIGNWLMGDEGVGIHLIETLSAHLGGYENVTLVDGGTSVDAMMMLDDVDRLIVLDAVTGGNKPGTIYRFNADDIERPRIEGMSLHEWSAGDSLTAMSLLGKAPRETVIIGIEPGSVEWDTRLSEQVEARMPEAIQLVLNELEINKQSGRNA
jgi:hydrogenase maturation protease